MADGQSALVVCANGRNGRSNRYGSGSPASQVWSPGTHTVSEPSKKVPSSKLPCTVISEQSSPRWGRLNSGIR